MSRLRVLSLIDIPWNSGLAAYAFDQALALRSGGHDVSFACHPQSAAAAFAAREGFAALPLSDRRSPVTPAEVLRLRRLASAGGFDVLAPQTGRAQTIAWLASFLPGRRYACVRTKSDARPPARGLTFSRTAAVIAASEHIRAQYLAKGFPAGLVATVRQGIAAQPPTPPPGRPPYRVGVLGRLDPVKGHAWFLESAAELLKGGARAEFLIAGGEANVTYAALREAARTLGLGGSVSFLGKVENALEFMADCDVGVVPSLGSEAVSRAALEWLAAGRPLVASAVGSLPEYAGAAFLVPPGDRAALAAKLGELLSSPERRAAAGRENRARAERDFSQRAFAEATLVVFERAAARGKRTL